MDELRFAKLHGLGNDFLIVDAEQAALEKGTDLGALARRMCDRRAGVGADGLILLSRGGEASTLAMRLFNADGGAAELSGNGARCALRFAQDRGWLTPATDITLRTARGATRAWIGERDGAFHAEVDLGPPEFASETIPVRLDAGVDPLRAPLEALLEPAARARVEAIAGARRAGCVSMGNPHVVLFTKGAGADAIDEAGPLLQASTAFPRSVNAHLVEPIDARTARLSTWERGVGRTLACGTGAAAAAVCGWRTGVFAEGPVRLRVALGELDARWNDGGGVVVGGPAAPICEGVWRRDAAGSLRTVL